MKLPKLVRSKRQGADSSARTRLRAGMGARIKLRNLIGAATAVATASVVALAVAHPGIVSKEVNLNDGGVWVTNQDMRLVGHLSYQAQALDGRVRTDSTNFDVRQNGATVFVANTDGGSFTRVDPARVALKEAIKFAGADKIQMGGSRIGYADAKTGKVWLADAAQAASFNPATASPVVTDMPGAVLSIGSDGVAHVVSLKAGKIKTLTPAGEQLDVSETKLPKLANNAKLQVSAVGKQAVVLDTKNNTLVLPSGDAVHLNGTDLQLQEAGPEAKDVLVGARGALLRVNLDDKKVTTVKAKTAQGSPSRPVLHRGCVYAAWSGQGSFLRDCPGTKNDLARKVSTLNQASQAVFRTNRDVIVLNDVKTGGLWLPDKDMVEVKGWEEVKSKLENEDEEDDSNQRDQNAPKEHKDENHPPKANNDEYGVRAGGTAYLPVINNDTDEDADVLTAAPLSQPSWGNVAPVRDGAALQVRVDAGATGSSTFTYELSDGRASAQANVQLTVHPDSVNEAPKQTNRSVLTLATGAQGQINVSNDWLDPDGDQIYIKSVQAPSTMNVTWRADGTITIKDTGTSPGDVSLKVIFSDGRADGEGSLNVSVKAPGNLDPITNGDHLVTPVGVSAQLTPMDNDSDPNGGTLRLTQVDEAPAGLSVTSDLPTGVLTFTPTAEGTYYLNYQVSNGPKTASGFIRVDAIKSAEKSVPIVQDDVTSLPEGGSALVAALDNDTDPTGGVLSVQSVKTPDGSPLVAAVLEHRVVKITAPSGLSEPATLTYTAVNQSGATQGTIRVVPTPATDMTKPPQLNDDNLVVRVGDVGSISVLNNDRSPGGLKLTVQPDLQSSVSANLGKAFVSDNVVRFRAANQPGSGKLIYTVRDASGNVASAAVNLTVVGSDPENDTAPHPQDVQARAVAGEKVTIPIPLQGIDAEGDSVSLTGLATSPTLGSAEVSGTYLTYTAANGAAGTDVFSYTVTDRLGRSANGQVKVGVSAVAGTNQQPVAISDSVRVRPGVKVSVPVLSNDLDPDGDPLSLVADDVRSSDDSIEVSAEHSRVVFKAPEKAGTYSLQYGVSDGHSEPVIGLVTVVVSPDAALVAPIARDDEVSVEQVRAAQGTVKVSVLDNDEDPDGDIESDRVTSSDPGVKVSGKDLLIEPATQGRYVLYTVTDKDSLSASAVVWVPGNQVTNPELNVSKTPIHVKAGTKTAIALKNYVRVRSGRSVSVPKDGQASASAGWDGSTLVKDSATLEFGAKADYSGPSSITVTVTDGSDDKALSATLTIPLIVDPGAANRPPQVRPTAIEVAVGGQSVSADMSSWVSDPDGDDPASMTYTVSGAANGIQVSVDGHTLKVQAGAGAKRGNSANLALTVRDAKGASTKSVIPVSVTGAKEPLVQLSQAQVSVDAGKSTTVDVANYATNPFTDTPIHLVGSPSSSDGITVRASGTSLTISARDGLHGTYNISYRVGDKTNDTEREVSGTIAVSVRGLPDAPSGVSATTNGAGSVTVSFTAGASNGADITNFTVHDTVQGDLLDCGVVTSCIMAGRTPGVTHSFYVVAHNAVGQSPRSNTASVQVSVVPTAPGAPVGKAGDGSASFTWNRPNSPGSRITGYVITLSPGGASQNVTEPEATFTGLTNGTPYTATVRAVNAQGASQESAASQPVTPYGKPGPPTNLTAVKQGQGSGGTTRVLVSWNPPANTGGLPISHYLLSYSDTPTASSAIVIYGLSKPYEIDASVDRTVRFAVRAVTRGGTSEEVSYTMKLEGKVSAPSVSAAPKATGADNSVNFTVTSGDKNSQNLEWSTDQNTWQSVANKTGNGLTNGKESTIYVRACNSSGKCSEGVVAGKVTPFGAPISPTLSCTRPEATKVSCQVGPANGNGRSATSSAYISADSGAYTNKQEPPAGGGTVEFQNGVEAGKEVKICTSSKQVTSEAGTRESEPRCQSLAAPSAAEPKPANNYQGFVDRSQVVNGSCGSTSPNCYRYGVKLWDWKDGSTAKCTITWAGKTYSINADAGKEEKRYTSFVGGVTLYVATSITPAEEKEDNAALQCESGTHQ